MLMTSIAGKLKPYYIKKALRYLRHYGVKDFAIRVRERLTPEDVPYDPWFRRRRAADEVLEGQREKAKAYPADGDQGPLFSVVVPCWHTPALYLKEMTESVLNQTWGRLELILVNASPDDREMETVLGTYSWDARVRIIEKTENQSIAANTNAGIQAARGDYICFLDHDDVLEPDALYEAAMRVLENPELCLLYTDEDKIRDDGKGGREYFQPHFKPDFNLDLLRANNYICHFLMVKRSLIEAAGMIDAAFEGAQDYEFILRCVDAMGICEAHGRSCHIPRVLYHWRVHSASTADNPDSKSYAYDSGQRAIEEHLSRAGEKGQVLQTKDHGFYRVRYEVTRQPKVSVIIPNRESAGMLRKCLTAIREHTDYENYEVLVVENNSSSAEILRYYKEIQNKDHVRVIRWKHPFNFSAVNNFGASKADGEFLVFMNNDVEVREGWLTELLGVCLRPYVGAAGAKLYFPDGKVQSAGVAVGIGGVAGSLFAGMNGSFSGYLHRASTMQELSAVTAALMMVRREAFEKAGGFTEELAVAFNDVDLCLKIRQAGYSVVYDPWAEAVHHESLSRGDEYTKEKAERWRKEASYMKETWKKLYESGDPFYNPNLSLARWDYSIDDR